MLEKLFVDRCYFVLLQGPDGVDLEMNLNGKHSRRDDDDDEFDDMVHIFLFTQ